MKAVCAAIVTALAFCLANPAYSWGCRIFDAIGDANCPPHRDYVAKRVDFFCGESPRRQLRHAAGDCRRDGIAFNLRQFTLEGQPAVRWSVKGRKSRATLATGCFCVIDE